MRKKNKAHSLSIFLLKEHVNGIENAIKDRSSLNSCAVEIGTHTCDFLFRQNPGHLPSWVKLFQPKLDGDLDGLRNSGTAAVLLVLVAERYFAFTFGYGKSLLNPDCYEENFGLRVVLNSVDPKKLRSIDVQSLDAVPVSRRNQASIATEFADFGLDIEQDLVCAATGKPKDTTLGKSLTGKDAIKITLPLILDEIPALLEKLIARYQAEDYKENFAWIDHLREVRSPSLLTNLNTKLEEKIRSRNFDRTWLSIPEIIEWSDINGFKIQRLNDDNVCDDISWEGYLEFLGEEQLPTTETFRRHQVFAVSSSSEQAVHSWPIYKCIYCEVTIDGKDYALNNGKWYCVDADFLAALNTSIKSIPSATISLPTYQANDEGVYNLSVHESNPSYYALMDKKMIQHGGGSSTIEFCDLFTTDKRLIHVKRYAGSSVLSHLFSQGSVSANLFLSDKDFRIKVNQKLPSSHQLANVDQKPESKDFEIIFAIASKHAGSNPELPLFSKINLRNSYRQLTAYNFKVSLMFIPVIPLTQVYREING